MEPIQLEGMNRKLSPPPNWNPEVDGECGDLHVFAQVPPGGSLRMTSAWKPDAEELAALARGCPVALTVFGSAIPPMALGVFDYEMPVEKPPALPPAEVNALPEHVRKYIMWLETDADPAGTIRENFRLNEENKALRVLVSKQAEREEPVDMTAEDAACPIFALAPAEYSYWEKRVWRRGVCDAESKREVQASVRQSQDAARVNTLDGDLPVAYTEVPCPHHSITEQADGHRYCDNCRVRIVPLCKLCGEPMPVGEEMFQYHGHSGPCPTKELPDETTPK